MDASELRKKNVDDLAALLSDLREEQFKLRFQHATGQLENHRRLLVVKRDIARILTIQSERARAAARA